MSFSILEKISCTFILLTIYFEVSSAILCYQCNSEYDPRCGDPFDSYSLGQVNCSMKTHLEHLPAQDPVLCRKTTQKIFGKIRVVRDCGYLNDEHDDRECFKKIGTFEVQSFFCSCTQDLCNATPATTHQTIYSVQSYVILVVLSMLLLSNGNLLPFSILLHREQ